MKKTLTSLLFLFMVIFLNAQTVENIRVEQDGDNLKILYRIGGSTSDQLYHVTLTCSIDGGPKFEPKSVIGDVGNNIRGGKSYNTIVWNVFDDVDEIGKVEFFIKVDLTSGELNEGQQPEEQPVREQPKKTKPAPDVKYRKFFVGYGGSFVHPAGIRLGTVGNVGFYGNIGIGKYTPIGTRGTITGGLTKRLSKGTKFRLHAYTGLGVGDVFNLFEFEFGMIGILNNRINLNLGYAHSGGMSAAYGFSDLTFGFGIVL